jgi:hypothetical protein
MAPRLPDAGHSDTLPLARRGISRFPLKELLHMPGSSTTPGQQALAMTRLIMLPSALETASAPGM